MAVRPADPTILLPPILACLQTARFSSRPPPDLLPLVSPILRQRINIWTDGPQVKNWASLLTWAPARAESLVSRVQDLELEPHPVSGELEVPEDVTIRYRRLDAETLQARLEIKTLRLAGIFVWCEHDEAGGGAGWRLGELMSIEHDSDVSRAWSDSIPPDSQRETPLPSKETTQDEDDYWALYDQQPASGGKQTPAPTQTGGAKSATAEQDYYNRYATEVDTAIGDPHVSPRAARESRPETADSTYREAHSLDTAQIGVRLHMTAQIRSLAQLAQSIGISKREFMRIARAELDQLARDIE